MADTLPDWAAGILGAIGTDTGLDLSGLANAFSSGGGAPQMSTALTLPNRVGITPGFAGGGGGDSGGGGAGGTNGGGSISYHVLGEKMRAKLGFRPKRKTVLYIIRTLGFVVASSLLGLDVNDVLWLFMRKRGRSRRHFVQTMLREIRKGRRYEKQLSHVRMPRGGGGRRAPVVARRRRRRRAA